MKCEGWKESQLKEIIQFKNGKKRPNSEGKIPIYGGNGILGYCNESNYNNVIAIGRVGAYCGSIYYEAENCWVSDNAIAAKCKNGSNTGFLVYLLQSLKLNERSIGTGQPLLTQEILNGLNVLVPQYQEQKVIADTLSCLDDKIELNNRMSKTLEEMAQAIFKSWFVDFEPFQDGEFIDSELGPIPKGWRVGTLGEVAEITMGQSPAGSSYNESGNGTVFYQGRAEFGWRYPTRRLYTTEPKRMAQIGDVLMSVRAPVGDINIAAETCCIGRGLAALRSTTQKQSYLHYLINSLRTSLNVFNGEGTVFGSINKDALAGLVTVIPPENVLEAFETFVSALDDIIKERCVENINLKTIRDTLLPKLISGEIRVPWGVK